MQIVFILKMQIIVILKVQIIVILKTQIRFPTVAFNRCPGQVPEGREVGTGSNGSQQSVPPPHPHSVAPLLRLPQRGDAVLAVPELSVCGQGPRGPAGVQSGNTNDDDVNLGWRCVGLSL